MAMDATPPPTYSQSGAQPTSPTPRARSTTTAAILDLPPPDSDAWEDMMGDFIARKTKESKSVPGTPVQPRNEQLRNGQPSARAATTARAANGRGAATAARGGYGRGAFPLNRAVAADAPPGVPAAATPTAAAEPLAGLKSLIRAAHTSNRGARRGAHSSLALDVSITVAGLEPGEADALREALASPNSRHGVPLSPRQLEEFIELRKQHNDPLTYEQIAAIRAADATYFFKDGQDDARLAGHIHVYYLDSIDERRAVFRLGTIDLVAQATLMDRQTDSLTIIASVRPETRAQTIAGAQDLAVEFHVSRSIVEHGDVLPAYKDAVEAMKQIFVDKIAVEHVRRYGNRIVNSGRENWTKTTCVPLTPTASRRLHTPVPPRDGPAAPAAPVPAPTPAPTNPEPARAARAMPHDEDDMFSPQAGGMGPAQCSACADEVEDPEMSEDVQDAFLRAAMHSRGEITPGLPVQLALQFPDPAVREHAFKVLRAARGDASAMISKLLGLGLCGRHALKLASAAAEDIYQGMGLIV